MAKIEKFIDTFIEIDQMNKVAADYSYSNLKFFHNCQTGGARLEFILYNYLDKKYFDDYISMTV